MKAASARHRSTRRGRTTAVCSNLRDSVTDWRTARPNYYIINDVSTTLLTKPATDHDPLVPQPHLHNLRA